jgi:type IV pilus assembly protein PilE
MARVTLRPLSLHGFSLVEISITLAVAGLLASLGVPTYLDQITRSRRVDATVALQRLQWAQERHRQATGAYALRLDQLRGATDGRTETGLYRIELHAQGPDSYELVALAQADQTRDRACLAITLRVQGVISERLPSARCWSA